MYAAPALVARVPGQLDPHGGLVPELGIDLACGRNTRHRHVLVPNESLQPAVGRDREFALAAEFGGEYLPRQQAAGRPQFDPYPARSLLIDRDTDPAVTSRRQFQPDVVASVTFEGSERRPQVCRLAGRQAQPLGPLP